MHRHPHFDLHLHDDDELAAALGAPLTARVTLAEWPLSCVQRVTTADGRTRIYKTQAQPTVEPEFYARVRSPLLVAALALPHLHGPNALLLEEITGEPLAAGRGNSLQVVDAILGALAEMTAIEGELPALADLRTEAGWAVAAAGIAADLRALAAAGTFRATGADAADRVERAAGSQPVLAALAEARPRGYAHMDLRRENVFATPGGYRVIDWQRPIYGPPALDRATLLGSLGVDPLPHVGPGVMALLTLLQIGWLAACARRWFPPGAPVYDAQIARLLSALE